MKILLNGLGPKDTVTHNEKIFKNGSVLDIEEDKAKAYIDAHLATEIKSEDEAAALQRLEIKNAERRNKVQEKAKAAENAHKAKTEE